MAAREVTAVVKSMKQSLRTVQACRDHLAALHSAIFEADASRAIFTKFMLNATGGVAALVATAEHHAGDAEYMEALLVFMCNLMHFRGRRNNRAVAKFVRKGGPRVIVAAVNRHSANVRVVQPAAMALIAVAAVDAKVANAVRLSGALSALIALLKTHRALAVDSVAMLVSCMCTLCRCEANLVLFAKKGAIALLFELCGPARRPEPAVLKWSLKALCTLVLGLDECLRDAIRDGGVELALDLLGDPGATGDTTKAALEFLRAVQRTADGRASFANAGGVPRVVSVVTQRCSTHGAAQLAAVAVHLHTFVGVTELPLLADNDMRWGDTDTAEGDAPPWVPAHFSPELTGGAPPSATLLPDVVTVRHVKGFGPEQAAPSCRTAVDWVAPMEPLLVQSERQRLDIARRELRRLTHRSELLAQVVFDDEPRSTALPTAYAADGDAPPPPSLVPPLEFGSDFESGNLKRAVRVFAAEYDLLLHTDINTASYVQWFYFRVRGMQPNVTYKLNVINMEKPSSTFNDGQRPLLFSEQRFAAAGIGWMRAGTDIAYFKNSFRRKARRRREGSAHYYTLTFSVRFPHAPDTAYMANSYPYTYSDLLASLRRLPAQYPRLEEYCVVQSLCPTQHGNPMPLLTITTLRKGSAVCSPEAIQARPVCFVSARVHPGESGASFVCKGLLDFLLSDAPQAAYLRDRVVWKVVPMLNPDGVINGNHRCALGGQDLNRAWRRPCPVQAPTVYCLKELMRHVKVGEGRNLLLYGDLHGHSRAKNFFIYACSGPAKQHVHGVALESIFPRLLAELAPFYSLRSTTFKVQRSKRNTGRVVVYRELGVRMSFTLEGSMMGGRGCDFLPLTYDPLEEDIARRAAVAADSLGHFGTGHYGAMGVAFAKAAALLCRAEEDRSGKAYDMISGMAQQAASAPNSPLVASPTTEEPLAGPYGSNRRGTLRTRPPRRCGAVADVDDVVRGLLHSQLPAKAVLPVGGDDDSDSPEEDEDPVLDDSGDDDDDASDTDV